MSLLTGDNKYADHLNLGTLLYEAGDLPRAKKHYELALHHAPQSAVAQFNLGNVADDLGNFEEAIKHYEKALKLAPRYADPLYNMAKVYQQQKDYGKAIKFWRMYLVLDPTGEWADAARRAIKSCATFAGWKLVKG